MASCEVAEALIRLAEELEPRYLKPAMENACAIVRNDAVANAPVDTGELKRSIDFQVDENGTEGVIFSNVEYAPYVEIGTGIYSSRGTGRDTPWRYQDAKGQWHTTRGQAPQPFLEPALQQNTSKIRDCFEDLL